MRTRGDIWFQVFCYGTAALFVTVAILGSIYLTWAIAIPTGMGVLFFVALAYAEWYYPERA